MTKMNSMMVRGRCHLVLSDTNTMVQIDGVAASQRARKNLQRSNTRHL